MSLSGQETVNIRHGALVPQLPPDSCQVEDPDTIATSDRGGWAVGLQLCRQTPRAVTFPILSPRKEPPVLILFTCHWYSMSDGVWPRSC